MEQNKLKKYLDLVLIDNETESELLRTQIKRSGGKLLDSCKEFDVYYNAEEGKKSIAYKLTFKDANKTLVEEEVMQVFNKIIKLDTSQIICCWNISC